MEENIYYKRLKKYWESKGYKSANAFANKIASSFVLKKGGKIEKVKKDSLDAENKKNHSENINRIKRNPDSKPGVDVIMWIKSEFTDLNINWLLFGTGNMILNDDIDVALDPSESYKSPPTPPGTVVCTNPVCLKEKRELSDHLETQKKLIDSYEKIIKTLEERKGENHKGKSLEGGVEEPLADIG